MQIHKGCPILARLALLNVDLYAFPLVYSLHSEPTGPYAMTDLPELSSLPQLPQGQQFQVLDTLFEPSPELHTLMAPVLANQTFSSYNGLIDAVGGRMSALSAPNSPKDRDILFGILGSHPRLGRAPVPVAGHMSDLSKKEQEQLNTGAEEQAETLRGLNAEYEERFPGLRFVYDHGRVHPFRMLILVERLSTAAAGRPSWRRCGGGLTEAIKSGRSRRRFRWVVLHHIASRMADVVLLQGMCDIAKDRARKLQ